MRIGVVAVSLLAGLALVRSASAAELVTGGYVGDEPSPTALQLSPELEFSYGDGLELAFTPRHGTATTLRLAVERPDDDSGRRGLVDVVGRLPQLGIGRSPAREDEVPVGLTGTVLSGGLFLGGAVASDGSTEAMGAGVGYGPVTTWLTYGQIDQGDRRAPGEMLMLSTDLVASSWFSVHGDLAVTARDDREEADTAGRIGFRLKF